jgi:hypothetical protein
MEREVQQRDDLLALAPGKLAIAADDEIEFGEGHP